MRFTYKAKDKQRKTRIGHLQAMSLKQAKEQLMTQDLIIMDLKKDKEKKDIILPIFISNYFSKLSQIISGVSTIDKILFAKHLSVMIKSGLTLHEGIETVADQTKSVNFKKILINIIQHLDNGESLGNSLARYPKYFSNLFVNLIRVGESSGTLEENLNYLADHLDKIYELKKKIIAAAIYPIFIVFAIGGLAVTMSVFVLPRLIGLFESFDVELPLITQMLLAFIKIVNNYWLIILISTIVSLLISFFLSTLKPIKRQIHRALNSLPIIGNIIKNSNLAQISRTLGTLLKSGIPVDQSLEITAQTVVNLPYKESLEDILHRIKKGKSLHHSLKLYPKIFPATVTRMIEVGEKSGQLEDTCFYLAEFYEREVNNTTKNLTEIIEPILLIAIGLIVAFIAVAIILPIYQITRTLRA